METLPKNKIDTTDNEEPINEEAKEDAKRVAIEKVKQKATIVNIEDLAEKEARKGADAYMTESAAKSNIIKKIWKHTFFDEFYRQREVARVSKEIKESGNIYKRRVEENSEEADQTAKKAIIERFASEYDEEVLGKGEDKRILDDNDKEALNTRTAVKELLNKYASSIIDDEAFNNEKNKIIGSLKNVDLLKGANNYADNLFEIAQNARLAIEHGAKMEELDYDLDIIIGKAKSSLKTEAHFNWVDKGIDKMKKSKVGRFVSPAVLNTAVGLAYSLSVGLSKKAMSSKAAAFASLGGSVLVSSAFAGVNESQRVTLERKQHGIEMAEGGSFESGDKRREQMEKYGYQMESASVLTQKLHNLMFEKDSEGKEITKDVKQEDLDAIFASISEIEARNTLNDKNKIDLISYSNIGNVEKERTDLTIMTARAKVELRKKLEGDLKDGLPEGEKDFDSYLAKLTQTTADSLLDGEKGISAQDKAFRKYKTGRVAKKMAQTAVMGLVIGGTIQEGMAFLKDDVHGMVEGMVGHHDVHATMQTPFEHIRGWISGHPYHMDMGHSVVANIHDHNIEFPEGITQINNPDGTIDILNGDHVISSHFLPHYDASGNFDSETIAKLGHDGIIASATHNIIDSTKEVTTSVDGYGINHPGSTIQVARDGWYGNDTAMQATPDGKLLGADLNELQTHFGGVNGTGFESNGDAVLNISHMTPGGSFQGGLSIDAQEAMHKGTLMAMVTLDGAHQGQVIPVPIDANGNIVFDHNNPLWQQVFKPDANGHAVSHAKFIEIVEKMGADKNGVEHIRPLSTLVGEGLHEIKDIIPYHDDIVVNSISPSLDIQNPFFVPIMSRRPLEPVTFGKKEKINGSEEDLEKISSKERKDIVSDDVIETGVESKKNKGKEKGSFSEATETKTSRKKIKGEEIKKKTYKKGPKDKAEGNQDKNRFEVEKQSKKDQSDDLRADLEMLNKGIQNSKGIVNLNESSFKSEYGKSRYLKLKSIGDGMPVSFNKNELELIATELEGKLSEQKKTITQKVPTAEKTNMMEKERPTSNTSSYVETLSSSIKDLIKSKEKDIPNQQKKENVTDTSESMESERQVSLDELEEIIKNKIGKLAKIEKIDFAFKEGKLEVKGELNAGLLGGKIKIKGLLENSGDTIEVNKNIEIEARGYVKTQIINNLSKLAPEMKKYFEDKNKRSIKSINIKNGQIILSFK